jgi:hypothetical protein
MSKQTEQHIEELRGDLEWAAHEETMLPARVLAVGALLLSYQFEAFIDWLGAAMDAPEERTE